MNSDKMTVENVGLKNKLLNRVGQVALSLVSSVLVLVTAGAPAGAIDAAETAIASEGGKGVLIQDPMLGTSFEKILKIYYYLWKLYYYVVCQKHMLFLALLLMYYQLFQFSFYY